MYFLNNTTSCIWTAIESITNIIISIVAVGISVYSFRFQKKESNRVLEETNRAYVSIYSSPLIANRSLFYLVIKNFGNTQAIIKDFEVDPITKKSLQKRFGKDFFDYYHNSSLAPGQSFTHLIINEDLDPELVSKFTITYQSGKNIYTETFKFNLQRQHQLPSVGLSDKEIDKQFLELFQDYLRRNL